MALSHPIRTLIVAPVLALAVLFAAAAPAGAATRSLRPVALEKGRLVFKLRGVVKPGSAGTARLQVGRVQRRVSARQLRRASRRGVLKVLAPRALRKRLRRLARRKRQPAGGRRAPGGAPGNPQTGGGSLPPPVRRAALVLTTPDPGPAAPLASCSVPQGARYVSPSGSDDNPGTQDRPWQTLDKAEDEASPGTTVVLRGGSYGSEGHIIYLWRDGTGSAPITWVAQSGETPVIRGHVDLEGDHQRVCGLHFNGPTGPVADPAADNPDREQVKVQITGDDVELANSEVTGCRWHAGIYLQDAQNVRLRGNYVHDNGVFGSPAHANLDHGIYWHSGYGVIEGNRIEHNVAHAVQLYPYAHNVTVRDNKMTGEGRAALMISEEANHNEIVGNDIWNNRKGIQTWELTGTGNTVHGNGLWDNWEGNLVDVGGLSLADNQLQ